MVQCDKEKALKAREIAIKKMEANDFVAAQKILLEAQKLFPELDIISHLLTVCNVHCAAEKCVNGNKDWYKVFQVDQTADKAIIRKQYLKLSHSLHTDRNRFPGAEDAFKLVAEAYSVLYEPTKRYNYDVETDRFFFCTKCPQCLNEYKISLRFLNTKVRCQACIWYFIASDLNGQAMATSSNSVDRVKFCRKEASKVPNAAVETSKRNQDTDGNTWMNSDSNKKQRKNDSLSDHVGSQPAPTHMSSEGNIKEKAKTTGTADQGRNISCEHDATMQKNAQGANQPGDKHMSLDIYTYPDPEFHRFEKDRSCEKFKCGQIWALYDDVDTFPRLYGWIKKVEREPFMVHLIWLEAYPQLEQEKRWLEQEISIGCGTFRDLDRRAQYNTTYTFSHLIDVKETRIPRQVKILPEVGEVWAVYMNWAPDWTPSIINACEFAIGEVIERNEDSTKLWLFSKVDGYVSVFKPNDDEEHGELEIPARENLRFSHRIPSFILTGEKGGELCGFYELDPASVPYGFMRRDTI